MKEHASPISEYHILRGTIFSRLRGWSLFIQSNIPMHLHPAQAFFICCKVFIKAMGRKLDMNSFFDWDQPYFFDDRMPAGQGGSWGGQSQYAPLAPSSWKMHDHWGMHGGKWCHHGPWQESNDHWGSHNPTQHHQWHQQQPWHQHQGASPWGWGQQQGQWGHQGQWAQPGGQWGVPGQSQWHGGQNPWYGSQMGYMQNY